MNDKLLRKINKVTSFRKRIATKEVPKARKKKPNYYVPKGKLKKERKLAEFTDKFKEVWKETEPNV
jgi:hypothetical protein